MVGAGVIVLAMAATSHGTPLAVAEAVPRARTARGTPSPVAELRRSTEALRQVLVRRHPHWSPERDAQSTALRRIVDELLDFGEIARRTLGPAWNTLPAPERAEFAALLQGIIERRPLQHGMPMEADSTVDYRRESISDDEATVESIVSVGDADRSVRRRVDYKLLVHAGRWHVYDIVIDGVSLVDGYREQFSRIIAKESFDGLLRRMRKKLGADAD